MPKCRANWGKAFPLHVIVLLYLLYCQPAGAKDADVPSSSTTEQQNLVLEKSVASGATPMLTLKEAILLAMRKNPDVRNSELQRVIDKFSLAVAFDKFYPQVSLSVAAGYQNGSKPQYNAFPTTTWLTPLGTSIQTSLGPSYSRDTNGLLHPSVEISAKQPLLRGLGTAVNKADLADAVDNEKSARLTFKSQVTTVVIAVIQAYYQLVQDHNNLMVDQLSLHDDENTLKQMQAKVALGKAALGDTMQQQANIATRRLSISNDQNKTTQDFQNLLALLGLDPQAKLTIDKKIQLQGEPLPSLDKSIGIGLANNADYQQSIINCRKSERALMMAQDNNRWQLDATARLNQPMGGSDGSLSTKSFTLDLAIPIRERDREKSLLEAKISRQKCKAEVAQKKNKLVTDIINSYNNVQSGQKQIKLSENVVKLTQQSLEVAKIKFKYGRATTFELTSLQTTLTTAQLGYIGQRIQYLQTVENFYQTLGTTLQKWGVMLAYQSDV